jgi:predicted DCC family thiol-disulfide oxidoreductase YuxK
MPHWRPSPIGLEASGLDLTSSVRNLLRSYIVFYDAHCGLCRRSRAFIETRQHDLPMRWIDVNDRAELTRWPQIDPDAAQNEVSVLSPDGQVQTGYEAVITLLVTTSRLVRFLRPLLLAWPIRVIGGWIYHLISNHRHRLSKLLFCEA